MNPPDIAVASEAPPPPIERTEGPVFAEPWEAQAFGLVVALHARGVFTWSEWAATLAAELARDGADEGGADYYRHWLAALERLLETHDLLSPDRIDAMSEAWIRAAHATPHGKPILLENDPSFAGSGST